MNERIKELALDSGAVVTGIVATNYGKDIKPICEIDIEKFANLIIQECAEICREGINNATDWDSSYWDQACENRAETIRQHFGVTE